MLETSISYKMKSPLNVLRQKYNDRWYDTKSKFIMALTGIMVTEEIKLGTLNNGAIILTFK